MAMVVKSAVKDMLKKSKMRVSGDFWKAIDAKIEMKLKGAVERAKGNGRKTLRAFDL
jgi:hypothetical protein